MHDRALTIRRPYLFVTLTTVGLILLLGVTGTAIYLSGVQLSSPVPLVFLPVAVALAIWATVTHRWRTLGFRRPRAGTSSISSRVALTMIGVVLGAILLLTATSTNGTASLSAAEWFGIVGLVLLVAFVEETLFRSIFVTILRSRGTGRAMLISSLAFSLAHSVNVLSGQDMATTARQLVFAYAFGLAAAAIFLSTGTIWITLALHTLFNYLQFTGTTQTPAAVDWIITTALVALAIWLWLGLKSARVLPVSKASPRVG